MVYRIEGRFDGKDNTFKYHLTEADGTLTDLINKNSFNDHICSKKGIFVTYLDGENELKKWLDRCIYKPVRIFT